MSKAAYGRYKWIQHRLETDEEYRLLMQRLAENEPAFHAVLDTLTADQRSVIIAHLGLCAELAERTTEIACFGP